MRPTSTFVLVLASVSFLTLTLSGFHFHADAPHHDQNAPHKHVHNYTASPELDEDHIDISVFEAACGFAKCEIIAIVSAVPQLPAESWGVDRFFADAQDLLPQRHLRWRPELRGPPTSI